MKLKRVVVSGLRQVGLEEVEFEKKYLQADDILVETESTFISSGTELAIYTAKTPKVYQAGTWCTYPWKAGYANAGIVRAVGENVKRVQVDQRILTTGTHSSLILANENRLVIPIPDQMDSSIAAACRMATIGATSVKVSHISQNAWVAVYGLGLVGNFAAQAYRILGCKVIGIDPTTTRRRLAEKCGIDYTVGGSEEEVLEYVREITEGKMCSISVDAVGESRVVLQAMKSTADFGQVILLGTPRTPCEINVTDLLSEIHFRWISVRGALNFTFSEELVNLHKMVIDWVQTERMVVEPLISHKMRPEQIKEAYEGLLNSPEQYIGVALNWKGWV